MSRVLFKEVSMAFSSNFQGDLKRVARISLGSFKAVASVLYLFEGSFKIMFMVF